MISELSRGLAGMSTPVKKEKKKKKNERKKRMETRGEKNPYRGGSIAGMGKIYLEGGSQRRGGVGTAFCVSLLKGKKKRENVHEKKN